MKRVAMAFMFVLCALLTAGPSVAQVWGGTPEGTSGVDQGTVPNGTGDYTSNGRTFSGTGVDTSNWNAPMKNAPQQQTYQRVAPRPYTVTRSRASSAPTAVKRPSILKATNGWNAAAIGFAVIFMVGVLIAGVYAFLGAQQRISATLPPGGTSLGS